MRLAAHCLAYAPRLTLFAFALAIVVSASQIAVLAGVGQAAWRGARGESSIPYLLAVLAAMAALFTAHLARLRVGAQLVERVMSGIADAVLEVFAALEPREAERSQAKALFDAAIRDLSLLPQALDLLVSAMQWLVLVVIGAAAVISQDLSAAFLALILATVGPLVYHFVGRRALVLNRTALVAEEAFAANLDDLLLALGQLKGDRDALGDFMANQLIASEQRSAGAARQLTRVSVSGIAAMDFSIYWIFAASVILFPATGSASPAFVILTVFCAVWDGAESAYSALPLLTRGDAASRRLERIAQIDVDTDRALTFIDDRADAPPRASFKSLVLSDVGYRYAPYPRMATQDVNLAISPGRVVFVTGPNGSGKTTLLKLIAGVYAPASGRIEVDGRPARPSELRRLAALALAEPHILRRWPGFWDRFGEDLRALLPTFHLADKVEIVGDSVSTTTALSLGQRKRLALVAALAPGRPLVVLDEPMADQDPQFRAFFYQTLLDLWRREGRAVVVATHDDQYFDRADVRVDMRDGRIVTMSPAVADVEA
ncbi:ATP-binding cassette domain-containing protein [Roseiarcus fermentans]|nr:ATP-binding cassette domain-containing protein [Roseiarcus fermentans]